MPSKKIVPNKFEQFLKNRESLIEQYAKGDLTKEEFIEANYRCINSLDIKPFQKIDNVKKAIYNYQYYNVLAKYYQKKAHDLSRNHEARSDFLEQSNYYYSKKDEVTAKLLRLLDFKGIEAYFVKVKSKNLRKKLFEIVLLDYDNIILHSKSEAILNMLMKENVFINEVRNSLVDSYINQKY
ncbi:MAG TPA: hypothetical protein DEF39_05470 [Hungateiclostridium thermocellum]|jgi:hypothetical protein|uniref:Uncharacterized protein n=2 Tax=Acetivibrio thermocellus TaxID=1515 RepID=A3DBJ6_ACET2|nr:DUF6648 family protein [Acetivibrio thermocellus]CDG34767.1 hypothetical protein CTHBC1_0089 [Acetivibrio thermocellus BC1]ABN51325.1 hypothetical protein Cthe_0084 [Acetivibrio thermocellus ATCC 27405]ADU75188.1 hypothetical protein Clo1313_2147 [Acetivibrio thermocellus DSM 1313]ALX09163.1 hypothetical protein AD2_02175 [Acetivibrio thermocellus AD2]ANV76915.1 hypothetical protein LQRI_2174 [Acetivibrio thermocellus DSM 2360]